MSEIEKMLNEENRTKKNIGRSSRNKVRKGNRGEIMGLRQEIMTKGQLSKMNGECVTIHMDKPMTYETFSSLSDFTKIEYIVNIQRNFNASISDIGKMFNIRREVIKSELKALGINTESKRGSVSRQHKLEWFKFMYPAENGDEAVASATEPDSEVEPENIIPETKSDDSDDIIQTHFSATYVGKYNVAALTKLLSQFSIDGEVEFTISIKKKGC